MTKTATGLLSALACVLLAGTALAVIGAVVHQPVVRLLVGIEEPVGRDVGGERCAREQHAGECCQKTR